ncbi:MAG: GGDEF domain-containing protein [Christensenellales bacterium]
MELFTQDSPAVYEDQTVERLSRLAMHDDLTHLPNRRYLESFLRYKVEELEQSGRGFAVLFADIDNFTRFNNLYGHQTGDQVLVGLARGVAEHIHSDDLLGRWGGEEFLGVHALSDPAAAAALGENFRRLVSGVQVQAAGQPGALRITASVGVAVARPGDSAEALIARADRLMYQAKAAGKDQVRTG